MLEVRIKHNEMTYLHTDGTNDANFISISSPKVLWKFIVVRVTIVVLGLAATCYHGLRRQIYNVRETPV
jgi:hypothetical protein